jgi:hypothetical protein
MKDRRGGKFGRPATSGRRRGSTRARAVRDRTADRGDRRTRTTGTSNLTVVTASELRALKNAIERRAARMTWNPQPEDVQRSVAQLVLTLVEFIRKLMERQAIRRMEQKTLTRREVEAVGTALEQLERTIAEIGARFGLTPEDLNLDLGPLGTLM